jgi:hypothetical protein
MTKKRHELFPWSHKLVIDFILKKKLNICLSFKFDLQRRSNSFKLIKLNFVSLNWESTEWQNISLTTWDPISKNRKNKISRLITNQCNIKEPNNNKTN